jgi:predicted nucleic acid-binding protein
MLIGNTEAGDVRINYLDASVIVKLFVEELGSDRVRKFVEAEASVALTTGVCFAEALGVLSRVFKKGRIDEAKYLKAQNDLLSRLRGKAIEICDVDVAGLEVVTEVENLISHYNKSKNRRLDLSDAFQLVTIRRVLKGVNRSAFLLITADRYLAQVAKDEDIIVWDVLKDERPPDLPASPA